MKMVGPGLRPLMGSAPVTSALIGSPGMPNTSAGIPAPPSALLFEAPASMMPSTWPVPNFCGSFENLFDIAYDIQAAMSAPAPGGGPIAVRGELPRRMDRQ